MLIVKGNRFCREMSITKILFNAVNTDRRPLLDPDWSSGIRCNSSACRITSLPILLLFMLIAAEDNCIVRITLTSYIPALFRIFKAVIFL